MLTETAEHQHSTAIPQVCTFLSRIISRNEVNINCICSHAHIFQHVFVMQEISGESRVTIEVMDYGGPVANTNPKYGDLESPPMPPTVSPHLL